MGQSGAQIKKPKHIKDCWNIKVFRSVLKMGEIDVWEDRVPYPRSHYHKVLINPQPIMVGPLWIVSCLQIMDRKRYRYIYGL